MGPLLFFLFLFFPALSERVPFPCLLDFSSILLCFVQSAVERLYSAFYFIYYTLSSDFCLILIVYISLKFCVHPFFFLVLWALFMTIALSSLSGRFLTSVSLLFFWGFVLFFHMEHTPLFAHFSWLCFFLSIKGNSCVSQRWSPAFQLAPAPACLSNLGGCRSRPPASAQGPVVERVPRPVSVPGGGASFSTYFHADWKLDFRRQLLKYANIYSSVGLRL